MLKSLLESLTTDQAIDQVTDQVKKIINALKNGDRSTSDLMKSLKLSHRPTFRHNYLNPAIDSGCVELTQPDSPKSPKQRYRLTSKGRRIAGLILSRLLHEKKDRGN